MVKKQECMSFDRSSIYNELLVKTFYFSTCQKKRKIGDVDWSAAENAREVKRVLALKKDEDDCYHCPVVNWNHAGLTSKR